MLLYKILDKAMRNDNSLFICLDQILCQQSR